MAWSNTSTTYMFTEDLSARLKERSMEQRLKYRELPWSVALGVLPGKIFGTLADRLYNHVNWKRRLKKWGKYVCLCLVITIIIACATLLIDKAIKGDLLKMILELYNTIKAAL
jgi:hypothetical protein